jgi:dTDP-4-dehydrorhamnose 3,5-epimerase-like enzyme
MSTINDIRIIQLPKIPDDRGNLTFIEAGRPVPFVIHRSYWIYDVPGGEVRGGHAYKELEEFVIALSGSFDVVLNDGKERKIVSLNRSYSGLYVPNMIWRHLENFSTNSVCLILASLAYSADDYIRDYELYLDAIQGENECQR